MIALGILTTGFLGMLGLFSQSLHLSKGTADELTATYLASEGVEVAKNVIDHDVYATSTSSGWGTCQGNCGSDGGYFFDSQALESGFSGTDFAYLASSCDDASPSRIQLYYDPGTNPTDPLAHLYGPDANPFTVPTLFSRCVELTHTKDASGNILEVTVNSIVTWNEGTAQDSINLEDHFYDWNP